MKLCAKLASCESRPKTASYLANGNVMSELSLRSPSEKMKSLLKKTKRMQ